MIQLHIRINQTEPLQNARRRRNETRREERNETENLIRNITKNL